MVGKHRLREIRRLRGIARVRRLEGQVPGSTVSDDSERVAASVSHVKCLASSIANIDRLRFNPASMDRRTKPSLMETMSDVGSLGT